MSAGFVPWAVEALAASAALMVLVLLLRAPVRRAFGPDVAYALWQLPALRLALPPLPHAWHESVAAPVAAAGRSLVILVDLPLGETAAAPATQTPEIGAVVALLWVAGAAAFLGWHAMAHWRFCRRMLAERDGEEIVARGVHVIETGAAQGPLAFGIWRRYVAFPRDFADRYDADEQSLALAHELGHHARGDLVANWIALVVLALHWFNPIAWRAFRAFRADQEIANDARVLAGRDAVTRHLYACAILKAAHGGAMSAACHLHTIDDLKGRLRMLTTNRPSRARLLGGAGVIALLGLAGLGLTASGSAAAERMRAHVEKATGVELDKIALPAAFQSAPEAPEAPSAVAPVAPVAPVKPVKSYRVIVHSADGTVTDTMSSVPPVPPAPGVAPVAPIAPMAPLAPIAPEANVHVERHVHARGKDGDWSTAMANMPQVSDANCPDADGRPPVIHRSKAGKQVIIICTNRIERMSARAEAEAQRGVAEAARGQDTERRAYASALAGLRSNRAQIAANASMNEAGRREALSAIDESIAELESDLAHPDRD